MTREEIRNTPEIVDFMIDKSVIADSRMKLHKRMEELCKLAIKALEQEPKTGHWIEVTNGRGGHECNICHEYAPSYRSGDEYLTKYCPNCGCRMIESQKSEDQE